MNVNSKNLIQLQSICKNFNATICSVFVDFRFCRKAKNESDRYLAKNYVAPMLNTISLKEQITTEPETILDEEQKNDYSAFDGLISKMKLTAAEYETISILMAGFTMLQIGKILNVNRTTTWRRQNSIRKKYTDTLQ